jgi:hypothetical protein
LGIAIAVAVVAVLAAGYGFSALSKVKRELRDAKASRAPDLDFLLEKSDLEAAVVRERERAEGGSPHPEIEAVSQELPRRSGVSNPTSEAAREPQERPDLAAGVLRKEGP